MPELPEVEIASRQLRAWAEGRRIVAARAERTRVIRGQSPQRFARLVGHELRSIERSGKWMLLLFDGDEALLSHLGMTGKWIRRRRTAAPPSHVRATIELDDGYAIDYRDPRLFGRLIRGTPDELRALPQMAALGPDPLSGIDRARLGNVLRKTRRSLKEALMDQRTLAGLGNIQVSESLHRAKLHPERLGTSVDDDEVRRLAAAIKESLDATLRGEDSPEPITYVEEGGENVFLVYDRAGQPCRTCRTPIERIVQGGRSTYFCPRCQPARRRRLAGSKAGVSATRLAAVRPLRMGSGERGRPRSVGEQAGKRKLRVVRDSS
ncbi:MAG: bifunctional DNA-formamidopyrimidine glycosylase/DNA-(apurinic or apyrimidinic site) lyase [Deltaproteobacteria bacterium]|nr:MAG: bifunctional DNA-formamidopyrimidine glycosylase/DNA-(apurinic or apyrimidinic site) lyase [Deltaproteobacteria bacterium]TMB35210.1 MAG: bifunctional DNA-formamidopyrimidine glycosylase/DNA-(apurinic or apyrimidinic site) lyase [Deltaproteobacteria bacterium]